jgi:hypothetical protein
LVSSSGIVQQPEPSRENGREREGALRDREVTPVKAPGFGQTAIPPAKPGVR